MKCFKRAVRILLLLGPAVLWAAAGPLCATREVKRETIAPGCFLTRILDTDRVLAIFVLKIDLRRPGLRVEAVLAHDELEGRETVPAMVRRLDRPGHRVLAAVNGDFFSGTAPSGLSVNAGRLDRVSRGWSSLVFSSDNRPFIGVFRHSLGFLTPDGRRLALSLNRARRAGSIVIYTDVYGKAAGAMTDGRAFRIDPGGRSISTRSEMTVRVAAPAPLRETERIPSGMWVVSFGSRREEDRVRIRVGDRLRFQSRIDPDPFPVHSAVSGGPRLVRAGKLSVERDHEGQRKGFEDERHPRTAAGYTGGGRWLFLAVVDGRQPNRSRGMNLFELSELMLSLGCDEAVNLDGGGSSTMVAGGNLINHPSDPTGPRPVVNALMIFDDAAEKSAGGRK